MADITEIKRMLETRTLEVAQHLLPNGMREGHEWRCGSIDGEAGKSLGVHLTGDKAGIWQDFNGDEGGDLLDLWCAVKRMSLSDALNEARDWLGIARPKPAREPKKDYSRPAKPTCTTPHAKVLDYLREDRNLPAEIIELYQIGERGNDIVFPFLLPDGTLALVKKREAVDGASPKPTEANCEPCLFGWQAIPDNAREVVLTEGEIDAPSWRAYGYPALSVPFGGGGGAKQQWIENEFERMERFEKIYIATDMDEQGEAAAEEIASRLGRHRCLRVKMPRKDGNACLAGGVSQDEMDRCIAEAVHLDPEGLRRASDFTADVIRLFWPANDDHIGYRTPYRKLGNKLLFRPGEVTLWSGASGAGKSQVLSHCIVDWIAQGSRVCLSSLEMKAAQSLKRMCKQVVAVNRPTQSVIEDSVKWLDRGLLLYERVGKSGVDGLLDIFAYARAKYGCDQFVIDSFMRLGIASDDYDGQEKALFRIVDWTISNNVHTHLVVHSRKGDGQRRGVPETEDIKGAMEIGANAFNIVTVWRNRKLEEEIHNEEDADRKAERAQKPGVILNVAKQRNGDYEGKVGLWFDQETYRYRSAYERVVFQRDYLSAEQEDAA